MIDLSLPPIQRVFDVATRKGVVLDARPMSSAKHSAEEAAAAVGADVGQIVKALLFVAPRSGGRLVPVVCLVSGRNQVDPALLAAATGEVFVRAATAHEAHGLTGYAIDGIPPFGHDREVRTLMDRDLCGYEWIWASAGTHAAVFRIAPRTLRMLSNAVVVPVALKPWTVAALGQFEPRISFEAGAGA